MFSFMNDLFLESDYTDEYEKAGVELSNETRFAHIAKDYDFINAYQILKDEQMIVKLPYYDVFEQVIWFVNVLVQHVNILDDYVELVILVI